MILRGLLIVATPYQTIEYKSEDAVCVCMCVCERERERTREREGEGGREGGREYGVATVSRIDKMIGFFFRI